MTDKRELYRTEDFVSWFKASKVIDSDTGLPQTVFGSIKVVESEADDPEQAAPTRVPTELVFASSPAGEFVNASLLSIQTPLVVTVTGEPSDYLRKNKAEILALAEQDNFDGLIIRGDGTSSLYIAKRADQIRPLPTEHTPDKGVTNREQTGSERVETETISPAFYSALKRVLPDLKKIAGKDGFVHVDQAKQWLSARQKEGKFKSDELHWSGLTEWLDIIGGRVAADDVIRYVDHSGIHVDTIVRKAAPEYFIDARLSFDFARAREVMRADGWAVDDMSDEEIFYEATASSNSHDFSSALRLTQYDKWTLDGGTNYREILLTLRSDKGDLLAVSRDLVARYGEDTSTWPSDARNKQKQLSRQLENRVDDAYWSKHWAEGNVLAHIRVNDRTDSSGLRTLFVEEIQSDFGQDALRKGVRANQAHETHRQLQRLAAEKVDLESDLMELEMSDDEKSSHLRRLERITNDVARLTGSQYGDVGQYGPNASLPPAAPFVTSRRFGVFRPDGSELRTKPDREGNTHPIRYQTAVEANAAAKKIGGSTVDQGYVADTAGWLSLATKRLIRLATDEGYDRVAFISGAQASERYDLSNQVDQIRYIARDDGTYDVWASNNDGGALSDELDRQSVPPDKLEEFVGKEVSKKILAGEGRPEDGDMVLSGLDLKVGGDGMLTFYDQVVPQTVNDVLRKLGGPRLRNYNLSRALGVTVQDDGSMYNVIDENGKLLAPFIDERNARAYIRRLVPGIGEQRGFDMTPELKAKVVDGIALFSRFDAAISTTVDGPLVGTAASDLAEPNNQVFGASTPIPSNILGQRVSKNIERTLRSAETGLAPGLDGARALRDALREIARLGPHEIRPLAKQALALIPVDSEIAVTVDDVSRMNLSGALQLSPALHLHLFTAEGRTGLTYETILHESLHAGIATKWRSLKSRLASPSRDDGTSIQATIALAQFAKVWEEFRQATENERFTDPKTQFSVNEARISPDEFFVRSITDPSFQKFLAGKKYEGKTLWSRFKNWVKKSLLGLPEQTPQPTWLDAALAASGDLVDTLKATSAKKADNLPQKETQEFKAWFDGSKITLQGQPKVVYHGTDEDFSTFDITKSKDLGFHFGDEAAAAHHGSKKMEVYLSIKNPIRLDDTFDMQLTAVQDTVWQLQQRSVGSDIDRAAIIDYTRSKGANVRQAWDMVQHILEAAGYDGVIYENTGEGEGEGISYIAFHPEQIKSATHNNSEFDPADPNIFRDGSRIQEQSEEFKEWFGTSKAVDEHGQPRLMYHGTKADFAKFSLEHFGKTDGGWLGEGFYFAESPTEASVYATSMSSPYGNSTGANVMPVYLSAKNPLNWRLGTDESNWIREKRNQLGAAEFASWLRSEGYDSVHLTSPPIGKVPGESQWMVLEPTQIKSAIGNNGLFNPLDPDINMSRSTAHENTAEFKSWFGNSKVVDQFGQPLEVFHGTVVSGATINTPKDQLPRHAFTFFDKKRLGTVTESSDAKVGFWFTSSMDRAQDAADDAKYAADDDATSRYVYRVYLQIQNPLMLDNVRDYETPELAKIARKAKRDGHDGIIFAQGENGGSDYLVFEPTQIKSSVANRGKFDPTNPDILAAGSQAQLESEEFKQWFGYSTLIDKNTRSPLVLYHGTNADISVFEPSDSGAFGPGIYLADTAEEAARWARKGVDGRNIMPVYVRMENPYIWTSDDGFRHPDHVNAEARAAGHDGIVREWADGTKEVVAFSPEQIKSAVGNRGTFSLSDPNVLFERSHVQEESNEFTIWFGKSEVVHPDSGKPLVVYHGTRANFTEFSNAGTVKGSMGDSLGFYFTDSTEAAGEYGDDGHVMPAYLKIENPLRIDSTMVNRSDLSEKLGIDLDRVYGAPDRAEVYWFFKNGGAYDGRDSARVGDTVLAAAKAKGYDGVIFKERINRKTVNVYLAFEPTQIKSAIGNVGTFDPLDPDIMRRGDRIQEQSKEFKAWFDGSSIVENGSPKIVYHGTYSDFQTFEHQTRRPEIGFHFGTQDQANHFAKHPGGRVLPFYLNIKNPLRMRDCFRRGPEAVESIALQLRELGILDDNQSTQITALRPLRDATAALREAIEKAGYDGIVYANLHEGRRTYRPDEPIPLAIRPNEYLGKGAGPDAAFVASRPGEDWPLACAKTEDEARELAEKYLRKTPTIPFDSYIAFHPNQIKSALGNNGNFDPADPNVLHSRFLANNLARDAIAESIAGESKHKQTNEADYEDLSNEDDSKRTSRALLKRRAP